MAMIWRRMAADGDDADTGNDHDEYVRTYNDSVDDDRGRGGSWGWYVRTYDDVEGWGWGAGEGGGALPLQFS